MGGLWSPKLFSYPLISERTVYCTIQLQHVLINYVYVTTIVFLRHN